MPPNSRFNRRLLDRDKIKPDPRGSWTGRDPGSPTPDPNDYLQRLPGTLRKPPSFGSRPPTGGVDPAPPDPPGRPRLPGVRPPTPGPGLFPHTGPPRDKPPGLVPHPSPPPRRRPPPSFRNPGNSDPPRPGPGHPPPPDPDPPFSPVDPAPPDIRRESPGAWLGPVDPSPPDRESPGAWVGGWSPGARRRYKEKYGHDPLGFSPEPDPIPEKLSPIDPVLPELPHLPRPGPGLRVPEEPFRSPPPRGGSSMDDVMNRQREESGSINAPSRYEERERLNLQHPTGQKPPPMSENSGNNIGEDLGDGWFGPIPPDSGDQLSYKGPSVPLGTHLIILPP